MNEEWTLADVRNMREQMLAVQRRACARCVIIGAATTFAGVILGVLVMAAGLWLKRRFA